ncbi:hypothetical protein PUR57_04665 [Streptomyces sp. JV176]|uniref:hypothetical protein n=1 Tax=Streptomyces sp. JV176 TaxID=858630 RepID=UPI002E79BC76|nr:hypothetical protein [Streptomyces sp. JV176]MEE1797980.1 hypothetical protein [Streptomyces sp. JV176]
MIPVVSNSTFSMEFLRKDSFSLETPFTWGVQIERQERRFGGRRRVVASLVCPGGAFEALGTRTPNPYRAFRARTSSFPPSGED